MIAFKDRVVVVTGASRGIGQAIAHEFADKEANVVIASRNIVLLEEVLKDLPCTGNSKHLAVEMDISREESIERGFERILNMYPSIDILVNNAGIAFFKLLTEIRGEDWDRMMRTNLKGAFLCSQKVIPGMVLKGSGIIVNISSVSAIKAFPYNTAYSAAKAGLLAFGNSLREEVRKSGVNVVNVIPGATDTPIWDDLNGEFDRTKMVDRSDIARSIADICALSGKTTVEEVIIRPAAGDF